MVPGQRAHRAPHPRRSCGGTRSRWSIARTTASTGLGGHLSTYASAASLYEVGFNHFFRGKGDGGFGDQVFIQGHAAPGIYARAFLEGRLTEEQLDHFRRETGGQRLAVVPAPAPPPDVLGVPDRVDGTRSAERGLPSALQPLPLQPRSSSTRRAARVWCFVGDGEFDEPESTAALDLACARAARQPDLRRELQPAAPRRPGARQRQGDPGVRVDVPRHGLERHQGRVGPPVGRAARPRRRRRARQQDEHARSTASSRSTRSSPARTSASTSSAPTRACARWSSTSPTRSCSASRAAATTTASSTPRTRPRSSTRARRRSSSPRRSRAGRSAPTSKRATPRTRSRR